MRFLPEFLQKLGSRIYFRFEKFLSSIFEIGFYFENFSHEIRVKYLFVIKKSNVINRETKRGRERKREQDEKSTGGRR